MQVDFMIWFQQLFENFTGFFNVFFAAFTALGEEMCLFLVLPIIYWTLNKEIAELLAFTGFASMAINGALKDICKFERPIGVEGINFVEIDNFLINTVDLKANSYSFPSGHAQMVSVGLFSLSMYFNKRKIWIWSAVIVFMVMLSRIYLGVHWPLDVVAGALLGLIIAYFGYKIFVKTSQDYRVYLFFGIVVLASIALIFAEKADTYKTLGASIGIAFGFLCEQKFVKFDPKKGTIIHKIIRVVIGLAIIFALKEGLKPLFNLISDNYFWEALRYGLMLFVAIALYPLFFKKVNL